MPSSAGVARVLRLDDSSNELARRATSFHAAMRFFPPDDRTAIETIYRFCRAVDDVADDPSMTDGEAVATLDQILDWLNSGAEPAPEGSGGLDRIQQLLETRELDVRLLRCLVEGVRSDRLIRERSTWTELCQYSFQVAGSVGMLMGQLLGANTRDAQLSAATLGVAMQLTNIIRDVGEDLDRGIVYLPQCELARHGYSRTRLERRVVDSDFVELMREQISRARRHYAAGLAGIPWLSPSARLPISIAGRLYAGILDEVEANGYDVFRRRASTSRPRKIWLAIGTALGLQLTGWLGDGAWPHAGDTAEAVTQAVRRELGDPDSPDLDRMSVGGLVS